MADLTKNDIITWYHTSQLPACGTEDLNKFMLDISIQYSCYVFPEGTPAGMTYSKLSAALKAFDRYKFNENDRVKIHADHLEIVEHSKKVKALLAEYNKDKDKDDDRTD